MRRRYLTILQYIFFFALGLFLVWWSVKDLSSNDKFQIKEALRTARYLLILPVLIILFFSHYIRALRWKLLIEPLGYNPKVKNTFFAVMIGYLTNLAFPRLGEILKCTVLAKYESIPVDKLIGTIIIERIIDAFSLLVIFAITIALQPDIYSQFSDYFFQKSTAVESRSSGIYFTIIAGGIILLVIVLWMIIKKKNWQDLVKLFRNITINIVKGVAVIARLKKKISFIFLTIVLWTLYLLGGYIGFFAFKDTSIYGLKEAFAILSAGSIGMILTPGGIGAYAILLEKTMQLYGLQKGVALAFGWLLWIFQTGVILLGGLFSFVAMPYFNKKKAN